MNTPNAHGYFPGTISETQFGNEHTMQDVAYSVKIKKGLT